MYTICKKVLSSYIYVIIIIIKLYSMMSTKKRAYNAHFLRQQRKLLEVKTCSLLKRLYTRKSILSSVASQKKLANRVIPFDTIWGNGITYKAWHEEVLLYHMASPPLFLKNSTAKSSTESGKHLVDTQAQFC